MKMVISIIISICLMLCLVGCGGKAATTNEASTFGRFNEVPNEKYLYYDVNTKVVYFIKYGADGYTYMSPYYASNGEVYLYNEGALEVCK